MHTHEARGIIEPRPRRHPRINSLHKDPDTVEELYGVGPSTRTPPRVAGSQPCVCASTARSHGRHGVRTHAHSVPLKRARRSDVRGPVRGESAEAVRRRVCRKAGGGAGGGRGRGSTCAELGVGRRVAQWLHVARAEHTIFLAGTFNVQTKSRGGAVLVACTMFLFQSLHITRFYRIEGVAIPPPTHTHPDPAPPLPGTRRGGMVEPIVVTRGMMTGS